MFLLLRLLPQIHNQILGERLSATRMYLVQHLSTVINTMCHKMRKNLPTRFVHPRWDNEQICICPGNQTRPEILVLMDSALMLHTV